MMRLPLFTYRAPRTLKEILRILAGEGRDAMLLAGGTDLLPNMKRRQQTPRTVIGLRLVPELRGIRSDPLHPSERSLGPCLTLSEIARNSEVRQKHTALWQAAAQIATPQIRNMGTLGGNLCLDTRCNYYDQNYEWRKAINFCLKKDGEICWVATGSPKCLAVSSTDTAPALMALGARVRLVSMGGEREIRLADLYRDDGIQYLTKRPDEILSEVLLNSEAGWRSTYWKLRRRGAFDFPVVSVAAAVQLDSGGAISEGRIVLGAVASRPVAAGEASSFLTGRRLDDATIEECASLAAQLAKPMDNTDFALVWRKRMALEFVKNALYELRGDDMRQKRAQYLRHSLWS